MRGRKPVPTALRVLRGNPGRRPLPADEPAPVIVEETRPPPDWLHDAAKVEWKRLAPMLARNGLLTEADLDALTAYCQAWCTWKEASQQIQKYGLVIAKDGYVMPSPYLPIANAAMKQIKAFMIEFGMTPSSRTRVSHAEGHTPKANPLERFLNRKR